MSCWVNYVDSCILLLFYRQFTTCTPVVRIHIYRFYRISSLIFLQILTEVNFIFYWSATGPCLCIKSLRACQYGSLSFYCILLVTVIYSTLLAFNNYLNLFLLFFLRTQQKWTVRVCTVTIFLLQQVLVAMSCSLTKCFCFYRRHLIIWPVQVAKLKWLRV